MDLLFIDLKYIIDSAWKRHNNSQDVKFLCNMCGLWVKHKACV